MRRTNGNGEGQSAGAKEEEEMRMKMRMKKRESGEPVLVFEDPRKEGPRGRTRKNVLRGLRVLCCWCCPSAVAAPSST